MSIVEADIGLSSVTFNLPKIYSIANKIFKYFPQKTFLKEYKQDFKFNAWILWSIQVIK